MKSLIALFFSALIDPSWATAAGGSLQGKILISEKLRKQIAPTAVLYVIARPADGKGPPLAVKRITQPFKFPISFVLSGADVMMPGVLFEGKTAISARLSQAGSATPVNPGDLESSSKPVIAEVGSSKPIVVTLDKVR